MEVKTMDKEQELTDQIKAIKPLQYRSISFNNINYSVEVVSSNPEDTLEYLAQLSIDILNNIKETKRGE